MKTYTQNTLQLDDSIRLEGIDYHLNKGKETRFFPQFKSENGVWIYGTPVTRMYGHKDIGSCQEMIDDMERRAEGQGYEVGEWRIKEEEV